VAGGAGAWGRKYLHAYANHPHCEIVALADRARERRQVFAEHYGIRQVFDTVDDLLAAEIPEIISIIFPVMHTPDAVIACAQAGVKAISCEKPIAVELAKADEMVRVCRERGVALGCGTAYWEVPFLPQIAQWVAAGHIGRLTGAAIPGGLPKEVSGAGCVQLTMVRLLTGMEVEWVEGWVLPPEQWPEGWNLPPGVQALEIDCPAYGCLGLSGGIVCEVPRPRPDLRPSCRVSVWGENGQVWAVSPKSVLIQGRGATSTPVYPAFLDAPRPDPYISIIEGLMRAVDTGGEVACSGRDYCQALEIAIALKLSAQRGHQRVHLPLQERGHRILPRPYRLYGGDVVGWENIGYQEPPQVIQ
jgi:hypothetical protein